MTKIITITNNKGSAGKTPTCYYLARRWARQGKRVSLIGLDGQANLSDMVAPALQTPSIADVLSKATTLSAALTVATLPTGETVQIARATDELYDLESELNTAFGVMRLTEALRNCDDLGDVVIIDTPSNLEALTLSAIVAAGLLRGWIVIPTKPEQHWVNGIRNVEKRISEARAIPTCNPVLLGIIVNQVRNTNTHDKWTTALHSVQYAPLLGLTPLRGGDTADYELNKLYSPIADLIWQMTGGDHP